MTKTINEKSEWLSIRDNLNQQSEYDDNWEKAITLFNERLRRKYFDPIQSIIESKTLKGEGFAIVTIQCTLIEMFAAFREGKIFTTKYNKALKSYEYSKSQKIFTDFLLTTSVFEGNFWISDGGLKVINQPYDSKSFYKDVRCGLLHEARTKGKWIIGVTPSGFSVKTEKKFITSEDDKLKIHRTVLHHLLLRYFTDYKAKLRQHGEDGRRLRLCFARKLDDLFDVLPDTNYNWWIE